MYVKLFSRTIRRTSHQRRNVPTRTHKIVKVKTEVRYAVTASSSDLHTGCNRRNGPDFGRVFLRSNYTDITQNTYIQSPMVTEILAREF